MLPLTFLLPFIVNPSRGASYAPPSVQKPDVALARKEPISGYFRREQSPYSIGGVVFDTAILSECSEDDSRSAVFDIGKNFASFVFAIGTDDRNPGNEVCRYSIDLDGVNVLTGEVVRGQRPVKRVVDVRGKRSLRLNLQNSLGLGEPTLSYTYIPPTSPAGGGKETEAVVEAGETIIEDGTVKLRWAKKTGATSYGILVVLDSPASGGSSRDRMWSYTVGRLPELNVPIKEFAKGVFLWYIVPLTDGKSLGRPTPMGDFKL